jgi:hypothetical protein
LLAIIFFGFEHQVYHTKELKERVLHKVERAVHVRQEKVRQNGYAVHDVRLHGAGRGRWCTVSLTRGSCLEELSLKIQGLLLPLILPLIVLLLLLLLPLLVGGGCAIAAVL